MNPLGINLSFAVKRWPEPEVWAKRVRKELGLNLVQFTFDLIDPWWPEKLAFSLAHRVRRAAEAQGITIHSAFVGLAHYTYNQLLHPKVEGRAAAKEWYKRAIDLAAELGVKAVGGPVGGMSVREKHREARYQELLDTLNELAVYARGRGLETLLIEPTPLRREVPWTVEAARKLAQDLTGSAVPFRYCLDIGHALYQPLYGSGASLEPWLKLGDRIGVLHLQQTDGQSDSHWNFAGYPELARTKGIVDPARVVQDLQQAGLGNMPVILEVFYPFELTDEAVWSDVKSGVANLKHRFVLDD